MSSSNSSAGATATRDSEIAAKRQKTSHGNVTIDDTSTSTRTADADMDSITTTKSLQQQQNSNTNNRYPYHDHHPRSFVTWNCNGFSTRAKYNRDQLKKLVESTGGECDNINTNDNDNNGDNTITNYNPGRTHTRAQHGPDMICIQEARLKARGPGDQRDQPLEDKDFGDVRDALREAFGDYRPFWSLADKKYAGTLTLIRKSYLAAVATDVHVDPDDNVEAGHGGDRDSASDEDEDFAAYTFRSAIDLLLRRLGTTRNECGLAEVPDGDEEEEKPAQQQQPKKQQTSLKSFFTPKAKTNTKTNTTNTNKNRATCNKKRRRPRPRPHHAEGRFQFFFFPGMDVIQTYVPNNGGKDESFARRRNWDRDAKQFLRDRKQILLKASASTISFKKGSSAAHKNSNSNGNDISSRSSSNKGFDASVDRKLLWCGK